jgi:TolA-binding protein
VQITEVVVSAGRTFNHPYEAYSNFRPEVTIKGVLHEGEDPEQAVRGLQAKAEELVEDHKNTLLQQLSEIQRLRQTEAEISELEGRVASAQQRLTQIRGRHPQLGDPQVDELPTKGAASDGHPF